MKKSKNRRRDDGKERVWRARISRWRQSGLTIREFCRRNGLSEPSFYAWRRELTRRGGRRSRWNVQQAKGATAGGREGDGPAFPFQRLLVPAASSAGGVEMAIPGGVRVRVRPGFDPQTLREVLEVLRPAVEDQHKEAGPC